MNKGEQRIYLKNTRKAIPKAERAAKSRLMADRLFEAEEYRVAKTLLIYISVGSEVETEAIMHHATAAGKRVAVPLCRTDTCTMEAYAIDSFDELEPGSYGIPEPKSYGRQPLSKEEIDLIIVPGLGFDKRGFRMGYGKGYYDRYLRDFKGRSIGLCFEECLMDEIVHDEYDVSVHKVITENQITGT